MTNKANTDTLRKRLILGSKHIFGEEGSDDMWIEVDEAVALFQAELTRREAEARNSGRIEVLREVIANPSRKTYWNDLLNDELKTRKQLTKAAEGVEHE